MVINKDERKDPKEYMKLAVEVMKKSIHKRKKKDQIPYVGAVLVFPDGTVETAYRGELREDDHAEYTLLDKKTVIVNCLDAGYLLHLNRALRVRGMPQKLVVLNELLMRVSLMFGLVLRTKIPKSITEE